MKVLKFGGTSVANAQNILLVEKIVKNVASDNKAVVVVSALSGVTDGLISAAELASAKNENYRNH
jgi:aspartokinase/homoserine dehydrogenase 1